MPINGSTAEIDWEELTEFDPSARKFKLSIPPKTGTFLSMGILASKSVFHKGDSIIQTWVQISTKSRKPST